MLELSFPKLVVVVLLGLLIAGVVMYKGPEFFDQQRKHYNNSSRYDREQMQKQLDAH